MTDAEQESMTTALSSFADASGLRLGEVFVETDETMPRQYGAVIGFVQRKAVIAILVPSEEHLQSLGGLDVVRDRMAHSTSARVVVLPPQTDEVGS
jgi:hypothetical protein